MATRNVVFSEEFAPLVTALQQGQPNIKLIYSFSRCEKERKYYFSINFSPLKNFWYAEMASSLKALL